MGQKNSTQPQFKIPSYGVKFHSSIPEELKIIRSKSYDQLPELNNHIIRPARPISPLTTHSIRPRPEMLISPARSSSPRLINHSSDRSTSPVRRK